MLRFFILFVFSFFVSGWGACTSGTYRPYSLSGSQSNAPKCANSDTYIGCNYGPTCDTEFPNGYCRCEDIYSQSACASIYNSGGFFYSGLKKPTESSTTACTHKSDRPYCVYGSRCTSQTEADSVICLNNGNLWIDGSCCDERCVCEKDGGHWNESTNSCEPPCNDHGPEYQKCTQTWDNGYNEWDGKQFSGGGYWKINLFTCYYDSCSHVETCAEGSSFPAGSLGCDDFQNPDSTQNCVAAIGSGCTIGCPGAKTIYCDCDGSCDHAKTLPACQCPPPSSASQSSSSGDPSSSASQSSSSGDPSSSASQSSSSGIPSSSGSGSGEGVDNELLSKIEYNTRRTANNTEALNDIQQNTAITAGYVSSIDKWQSTINRNNIQNTDRIIASIESASGALATDTALHGVKDSLHGINSNVGAIKDALLDSSHGFDFDLSEWQDKADSIMKELENPESTVVYIDSLKSDTTTFKTSYSSFFLHDVYTRNGCYEFKMPRPDANSVLGRFFRSDIVVNFGSVGGFDLCAILRGLCRIAGAILVLLISIKSYRSAFSSSDG